MKMLFKGMLSVLLVIIMLMPMIHNFGVFASAKSSSLTDGIATAGTVYTITFDPNGGTILYGESTCKINYGQKYCDAMPNGFPIAVKNGFRFDGWKYLRDNGEWFYLRDGDTTHYYSVDKSVVFYANWVAYNNEKCDYEKQYHNGNVYQLFDSSMTWSVAMRCCKAMGGHLVTITSLEEQRFIESLVKQGAKYQYWLGATDQKTEGVWEWVTGEEWKYNNWRSGQPDNYRNKEDYAHMYSWNVSSCPGGKWNDIAIDNVYEGDWNHFQTEHAGFICEWEGDVPVESGMVVYSDHTDLSIKKNTNFSLGVGIYDDFRKLTDLSGITFTVNDPSIINVESIKEVDNSYFIRFKGQNVGTTSVRFHDSSTGYYIDVPVTVFDDNKLFYTINSVPTRNIDKYTSNFYNVDGIYVDNYNYKINSDKTASVTFDVYNTSYIYGVVEILDKNGYITEAVLIDKMTNNAGSAKEVLWDSTCCMVRDFKQGDIFSYRSEIDAKETNVSVTVPEGGYIKISNDAKSSGIVAIVNGLDIALSIKELAGDVDDIVTMNKDFSEKLTYKMVKNQTYMELLKEGSDFPKILMKNLGKGLAFNKDALGNFAETFLHNIAEFDFDEVIIETAGEFGWGIGENVFAYFSGYIGAVLKGMFSFGEICNLVTQTNNLVGYSGRGNIYIQNQYGTSRSVSQLKVESEAEFSNDTALNVYSIVPDKDAMSLLKDRSPEVYEKICKGTEYTYNISLTQNGSEVQPDGEVTVYIPIPEDIQKAYLYRNIDVYRMEEDGSMTKMDATVVSRNLLSFKTTHFSVYMIVGYDDTKEEITNILDYEYITLGNGNIALSKYLGDDSFIKLPSMIDGYVVTAVAEGCFANNDKIQSIILSESVKTISDAAFSNCKLLNDVTVYDSVSTIEKDAFINCNDDLTIKCYKGSIAETYAIENSIAYSYLCSNIDIDNYIVTIDHADQIKDLRYAPGEYTTTAEIKAAEGNVAISESLVKKYTVDGSFVYEMLNGGYYTVWIRMQDGTNYILPLDVTHFIPTVSAYGVTVTLHDLYDVKDFYIAKGEYQTYREIKDNGYIVSVTGVKIGTKHDYTYTVYEPGVHTILIRYNDGTQALFHEELTVDEPVFTTNGLQITVSNLPDVKVIRTAYGEWNTVKELKATDTIRNFSAKTAIKGKDPYTIQYREEGRVTVIVEYNNGYQKVFHYDVTQKTPTVEQNGYTVTFSDLDGLVTLRYAMGEYTTSSQIKNAKGSKALKPADIVDGKITVELNAGAYTFCVQYDDESFNYYTITVK